MTDAEFDDEGKFVTRADYYGHDRRLANALTGRGDLVPVAELPKRRRKARKRRTSRRQDWWRQDFMQN